MNTNDFRIEAQDLNNQGVLLMSVDNYEAAQAKFDRAIEIDPMLVDSYKNYGDMYMFLREFQKAKEMYKKALLIDKNGFYHFLYGNACLMKNELQEGIEHYNLAVAAGYNNEKIMFFMGMAYEHMKKDEMALRCYNKACQKDPTNDDFLVKKIRVLLKQRMYDKAEVAIDDLLKKSPEVYEGYHFKTMVLKHQCKLEEAKEFSKAAAEKFPEDVDLLLDHTRVLSISGNMDEALSVIATAKKMKYFADSKRDFIILEAQINAEKQNFEKAIELCNECVENESEIGFDGEAYFMLMNLHLVKPDYNMVLKNAEALVAKNMNDSYYFAALYYKAVAIRELGDEDLSKKEFKKANSIYRLATLKNPGALDAYLYRVMCLKDLGEYDKALELLSFVEGVDDTIAEIYTLRSSIYKIQGKKALADIELERAYKIKPSLKIKESLGE